MFLGYDNKINRILLYQHNYLIKEKCSLAFIKDYRNTLNVCRRLPIMNERKKES
jgi:hypothetical protein